MSDAHGTGADVSEIRALRAEITRALTEAGSLEGLPDALVDAVRETLAWACELDAAHAAARPYPRAS